MKVIVYPPITRRVARLFMAKSTTGLGKYHPMENALLYVYYCPLNKVFLLGTFKHIYPFYITNDFQTAADKGIAFISKYVDGHPTVEY